jgi:small subunit ribosomal protein S5
MMHKIKLEVTKMLRGNYIEGIACSSLLKRRRRSRWDNRLVDIRRVTKVTKGGKQINFRAVVVIGDGRGRVGVGVGKGSDVPTAV